MKDHPASFYVSGGAVPLEASCYIPRQADHDLLEALREGQMCYVLTSRQQGKSSLRARTAARLKEDGVRVVQLDLQGLGQNLSVDQWYNGLLDQIAQQLMHEDALDDYSDQVSSFGSLRRWLNFLERVVLVDAGSPIVMFVDEIDAVRSLPFSADEFFAGIRSVYDARATNRIFRNLSFCLMGASTPSNLIRDARITPFNVGRGIELADFTFEEARPLAQGLCQDVRQAEMLLARILHWTAGQPYLTQRLCQGLERRGEAATHEEVDRCCERLFLGSLKGRDTSERPHILAIQNILLDAPDPVKICRLERLERILRGYPVQYDPEDANLATLQLSGVTRRTNGRLELRNRIYAKEFDLQWIRRTMPDSRVRRLEVRFSLAVAVACFMALLALLAGGLGHRATQSAAQYRILLYASQMNLAVQAWLNGNPGRLRTLLETQIPNLLDPDLRDFEWYFLWNVSHPAVMESSSQAMIRSVRFAPDGKSLATGALDGTLRLLDSRTGQELRTLADRDEPIRGIAYSPDGSLLAVVYDSGSLILRKPASGQIIRELFLSAGPLLTAVFSPDGRSLYAGAADGQLHVIDTRKFAEQHRFDAHEHNIMCSALSPDGSILATGGNDGTLRLWSPTTSQRLSPLEGTEGVLDRLGVWSLRFSPDGQRLLAGVGDGILFEWELSSRRILHRWRNPGGKIWGIAFGGRDGPLIVGGSGGCIRQLNSSTFEVQDEILVHSSSIWSLDISPDGKDIASAGGDDRVLAFVHRESPHGWLELKGHSGRISALAFLPSGPNREDGLRLASTGTDHMLRVWNVSNGQALHEIIAGDDEISDLSISPQGFVATLAQDNVLKIWDAVRGSCLRTITYQGGSGMWTRFSPDGMLLASGGEDELIRLWEVSTGALQSTIKTHSDRIGVAEFARHDAHMWVMDFDAPGLQLWDLKHASKSTQLTGEAAEPFLGNSVMVQTREGEILALAEVNRHITLWDPAEQRRLHVLRGHSGKINALVFNPEGTRLVSSSQDGEVKFWNVSTGQEVVTLKLPESRISSLAFSDNGDVLAMGSDSGKIFLAYGLRAVTGGSTINRAAVSLPGVTESSPAMGEFQWIRWLRNRR